MKTRNGFVSNSSTSSYVIVARSKSHENVVKELHKYYRAWLKEKVDIVKKKFDGKQIVVVTASFATDEVMPLYGYEGEYPEEAEDYPYGEEAQKIVHDTVAMDVYIKALKEKDKEVIVIYGD